MASAFNGTPQPHQQREEPAQALANSAILALGRGFDVTSDIRLGNVRSSVARLVYVDEGHVHDLLVPGGLTVSNVSTDIRCDKGESTRYQSEILSYQEMSERFNKGLGITGKMPLGLFNSMFNFNGTWQQDASATRSLALDGWFFTKYCLQLTRSPLMLQDHVRTAVPASWDAAALASFIETFGTHIIVSIKVGGKDVVYLRQHQDSQLSASEVQRHLMKIADLRFADAVRNPKDTSAMIRRERTRENVASVQLPGLHTPEEVKIHGDLEIIFRRRGGDDLTRRHVDWLDTVLSNPDVICMTFVPITSLLSAVPGSGFLSHAMNLYMRYKPPIEELRYFLEFQCPRLWSPAVHEMPVSKQPSKEPVFPSIQFSLMGPKLYVSTAQVNVGRKPITGLRLFLEGRKANRIAIHLQHLSTLPKILQPYWDGHLPIGAPQWKEPEEQDSRWFEPVLWKGFSHVSTAPIEFSESWIGEATSALIVTGAQLRVWDLGMKSVLYLRLLYSKIPGCSIRRSVWDHTPNPQMSAQISGLLRFGGGQPVKPAPAIIQDSALFSAAPPVHQSKLLKFVDLTEMVRGPQDIPGHWLVSGAKLDVDKGKISVRVKYSLLHY